MEAVIERLGIVTPTADADSAKKLKHTVELSKGQTFHLTGQFASGVKFTKPVQCFLQVQFFVTDSTGKEEIWATGGGIPEVNPKDPTDVRFDIPVSAPIQSGRCQFRLTNLEYHILVLGEANIR